jgi:hypothetical protein
MLERAGEAAGFDMKIHLHTLRYACGKVANDGHDTRTLQAYLGQFSTPCLHGAVADELRRFLAQLERSNERGSDRTEEAGHHSVNGGVGPGRVAGPLSHQEVDHGAYPPRFCRCDRSRCLCSHYRECQGVSGSRHGLDDNVS